MNNIQLINNTRNVIKEILEEEGSFDISSINNLSNDEIELMLEIKPKKKDSKTLFDIGIGTSLTITLPHKLLSINLHVFYYNISINKSSKTKLNKNIKDKIYSIFEENIIGEFDLVIMIVDENISETIFKVISELNVILQNDIKEKEIPEDLKKEINDNKCMLEKRHFRNVRIFNLASLSVNLTKNRFVPKHNTIRDEKEIQDILHKTNCTKVQLPIIKRDDIIARLCMSTVGDVIRIDRESKQGGYSPFYRLVR